MHEETGFLLREQLLSEVQSLAGLGSFQWHIRSGRWAWSEQLYALLGIRDARFSPSLDAFLSRVHPEDLAAVKEQIHSALSSGGSFETRQRFCRDDGDIRVLLTRGRVMVDSMYVPERMIGVCMDVTDQVRAEQAARQDAEDRLQLLKRSAELLEEQLRHAQKMESVGRLTAGIAHDFNNLLTVMLGYCELLLVTMPLSDANRSSVQAISEAGTRATALAQQLLAFSRQAPSASQAIDLNELVQRCAPLLKTTLGENIRLTVETDPTARLVRAQRIHVEQILMNLAINARDAMPHGGQLSIGIRNHAAHPAPEDPATDAFVELVIADSGMGMSQEVIDRIFEPFFTTKDQHTGTGLGLAIVDSILQELGGFVRVTSQLGIGSTFTICLPAAVDTQTEPGPTDQVSPLAQEHTVLLVEDDSGVSEVTQAILKQHGFHVVAARSGEEALQCLIDPAVHVDVVLADVVMTGLSGRRFAESVFAIRPGAAILFMSGHTEDIVVQHGIQPGEDNFIAKPYHPHALASKLRALLGGDPSVE